MGHLARKAQTWLRIGLLQSNFHLLGLMPCDDNRVARVELLRSVNDMAHQSLTAERVQNFGHTAFHARALARCHDHHI